MSPKTVSILKVTLAVLVVIGIVLFGLQLSKSGKNISNQPQVPTPQTPAPQTQPQTNNAGAFENAYLKMALARGWQVQEVGYAVNITKDKYVLYINPKTTQASGVEGGRFSEIAQGAPGVGLVMTFHPADPCGTKATEVISDTLTRSDYYVRTADATEFCNASTIADPVWYFSFVGTKNDGYFGDPTKVNPSLSSDPFRQFVITMSYTATDINALPKKGSAELTQAFGEMTEMVKSVEFK